MIDDLTTGSETSEQEDESDSDEGPPVRAQPLNFGDDGFNLSLGESGSRRQAGQLSTPAKAEAATGVLPNISPSAESVSSVGEEYVKVNLPITPSPQRAEAGSAPQGTKNITQTTSKKAGTTTKSPFAQAPAGTKGPSTQITPPLAPARVNEKALMPPNPVMVKGQTQKSAVPPSLQHWPIPPQKPLGEAIKKSTARTPTPSGNKVEIRPIAPVTHSKTVSSNVPGSNVYHLYFASN